MNNVRPTQQRTQQRGQTPTIQPPPQVQNVQSARPNMMAQYAQAQLGWGQQAQPLQPAQRADLTNPAFNNAQAQQMMAQKQAQALNAMPQNRPSLWRAQRQDAGFMAPATGVAKLA